MLLDVQRLTLATLMVKPYSQEDRLPLKHFIFLKPKRFFQRLNNYLREGFALAQRASGTARAIGFVMSIFQKIAASSFAAVKRTLQNRYIALAIYEAVLAEEDKNLQNYENAISAAKEMLRIRDQLFPITA